MTDESLIAPTVPSCDEAELAEFRRQIRALYDMKERALAAKDGDPIVNRFYASDAVTFGPDGKVIAGRAALAEHYANFFVAFDGARVESVKQFVRNGVGWDWANFIATAKDGSVIHAPMIFLWIKTGDDWISAGDVFAINPEGPVDWRF